MDKETGYWDNLTLKRFLLWIPLLLVAFVWFANAAEQADYVPHRSLSGLHLENGDAIVFPGDSITHHV